jgi:hypothetical protein
MDQSLPDSIRIQYALNPSIQATYTKHKKITFTSPDELKGRVANNIFEASYIIRNVPSFAYSDWVVVDVPKAWSVWSYERSVTTYVKRLKTSETTHHEVEPERKRETELENPMDLSWDQWTSEKISDWVCNHQQPELKLKGILYFRRYHTGLCFEFLCEWSTPTRTISTWQKYADLQQNPTYVEYIRQRWDAKVEKDQNWEDEIDRHAGIEHGFDVQLPEIGTAYAIEKETIQAHKLMEREKRKKKHQSGKVKKRPKPEDSDKSESDEDYVSDTSSTPSDSADETPLPVVENQPEPSERIEWLDIFDVSSVTPVPRYKVKKFKT